MNIKITRKMWLSAGITLALVTLTLLVSTAVAQEPTDGMELSPAGGSPTATMSYQGYLADGGGPANGVYDFRISVWDQDAGGNLFGAVQVYDSPGVTVQDGFFTLYFHPGVAVNEVFDGGPRWLQLEVRPHGAGAYTTLPRQPITNVPYAWGLHPKAVISGTTGTLSGFGDAILNIDNTRYTWGGGNSSALYARASTGSAVRGESGGVGVYGYSPVTYAIRGEATGGTAGYFTTDEGYGVWATTNGTDHWDHGGYFEANMGYGVYGVSAQNYGVRGKGYFGIRGDGTSIGVTGWSSGGTGVRGSSSTSYGVRGSSTDGRGVYGNSTNDHGMYGYTGSTGASGVVGLQTGYSTGDWSNWDPGGFFGGRNGVVGVTKATNGYGVAGRDASPSGGWAGYFTSSNGNGVYISAPAGHTGLNVAGGTKNAVVSTDEGSKLLYSEESTEVWFTDYGFGQLEDGVAVITIDEGFAQTVNLEEPYHVFVQVYGDAEIYISGRTPTSFEVHLRDGDPNVEFSYRIVAKRLGYEDDRLEPAPWADGDPNLYPDQYALDSAGGELQPQGGSK